MHVKSTMEEIPEELKIHFEKLSKEHAKWYYGEIRWLVNMLLDFSEKSYTSAMIHGQKHGYEYAMNQVASALNDLEKGKGGKK